MIKKWKSLVTHFSHSTIAKQTLQMIQKTNNLPVRKVKQDMPIRWGSTHLMIKSLLVNQRAFKLYTSHLEKKKKKSPINLDEEDFHESFDLELMEDDFPAEDFSNLSNVSEQELEEEVIDIWSRRKKSNEVFEANVDLEKQNFMELLKSELSVYRSLERVKRNDALSSWYGKHGPSLPIITKYSQLLHSIPPSSISSEELFSKAGLIYSNHLRNRLGAAKASQCLLIKASLGPIQKNEYKCEDEDEYEE
uniref:HAT C-terminal dimerisation domain-containing protein n=1 Tax=Acrobeloides nanus TaxID=290746 RepID=A0A914C829_9BILA